MYNKNMFNRKRSIDKYRRAHLKQQKIKARRHKKYMEFRRKAHAMEYGENVNTESFSFVRRFIISFVTFLKIVILYFKNSINFIKYWFLIFFKKIQMVFIKLRFKTIAFFSFIRKDLQESFAGLDVDNDMKTNLREKKMSLQKRRTKKVVSTKKSKPQKKSHFFSFKNFILFVLICIFVVLGGFFIWFSTLEIPSVQNFENRKISNSTKIYDKTGEILLYDIHEDIRRTVIGFGDINQSAKDAIVAIEDHTFYEHDGVVWKSTIRAIFQTLMSKAGLSDAGTAGGSTLTQQVVKNTLLNRDRVLSRKVKEWVLAYKIEQQLSKDEILEIYLNEAPYGGTVYGIQEASKKFFGIPASEVSVAQAAYLASIPNLPTFYSPYGPNRDKLEERQRTVLREMKRYGFISDTQYREALSEEVSFIPEEEGYAKSLHFVQYVRAQLEETYGVDMVQNGGLRVITTLDYELQQKAEEIIKEHIEEVEDEYNASNAALVAIEAETGKIIAMVGSRDYNDTEGFDGNFNVAIAPRQPGSSFKPIAYATAFERGYLPESTIFDSETQFNSRCNPEDTTSGGGCYSPNNYDFKFNGPMTFRNALAQSRNIPAIKINHLAGLSRVLQKARDLGITSLTQPADFYGLGLVLGGGEVSLLEMTSAYTVFANDGKYNKPTSILEITDIQGNTIEKFVSKEDRVLDKNAARMVNSILSDNVARAPLFGSQSFLYFGDRAVAGKTGTTNDNRDAWLIGYTPDVAVGVWTGNNDNSPMKKGSSITGKPWRKFMDEVIDEYDKESFGEYDLPENLSSYPAMLKGDWYGGTSVYIDSVSGKLATEFTPEETKLEVPQPDPHTILHWIDKNNPRVLNTEQNDSQYENWEYSVRQYVQQNYSALVGIEFDIPTEFDDVHGPNSTIIDGFDIEIKGIESDIIYPVDQMLTIEVSSPDRLDRDIEMVQYFINNAFVGIDESRPFEYSFFPNELQYFEANNVIRVVISDEDGEKSSQEKTFQLDLQ